MKIFITMVSLMMILTSCSKSPSSGSQVAAVNPTPNVEEVDGEGSHGLTIANGGNIESTGSVTYSTPGTTIADFGVLKYGVNENHTLSLTLKNKSTVNPYNVVLSIPTAFKDVVYSISTSTGSPVITFTEDSQNPSVSKSNVISLAKALTSTSPKSLVLNISFNVAKTGVTPQAIGDYSQLIGLAVDKTSDTEDVAQILNYNLNYSVGGASILTDLKAGFTVAGSDASIDVGSYVAVDDTSGLGVVVQPTIQNFSKNVNGYQLRKESSGAFALSVVAGDFLITNDSKCVTLAYPSNCKITVKYANTAATTGLKTSYFYINDQLVSLKVNVATPTPKVSFSNATIGSTTYAIASNSVTVGPFTNGEGIKNIKLNFKNEYLSTDANKKTFSDLALSGAIAPFSLTGSNCSPLNPSASCYNTISFDTTGKANNTYSMPFSFQSTTYPYELIQGTLNVVMNTVIVQSCTLADASNPLSGITSANGVKSVTGAFGTCAVQLCSSVYTKASDSKSCLLKTSLACAYDNAFGPDRGLESSTGVSSVKGNLGSCLVNACLGGFDKSSDEKTCTPSSVVACSMSNAVGNGLSTILNVASVSGNVPSCLVASCSPGFDKSSDSKTCIASVVACTTSNASANGVSMNNVLTVSGNVPACLVASCASGYSIASDSKSCIQDAVACNLTNAKTLVASLPSGGGAATAVYFARTDTSDASYMSPAQYSQLNSGATFVKDGVTATVTSKDLYTARGKEYYRFYMSIELPGGNTHNFDMFASMDLSNVASVKGNVPACLVNTCNSGFVKSQDEKSCVADVVACTNSNASANGVSMSNVLTVSGNVPACMVASCASGYSIASDSKSCIQDTVACTTSNASANGVTMTNVLTVSGNVPACLVASCDVGFSPASDSKSCIANQRSVSVIRGSQAQDLKCAVSVVGTPLVNDTTMIIDGGPASSSNQVNEGSTATVTLGSCAPGYQATLKEVVSASDLSVTPASATLCVSGVCSLPMSQDRFIKVDVSAISYPFNGIAILRENGQDEEITSVYANMDRSIVQKTIGQSVTNSASLIAGAAYDSSDCVAYAGKIGAINLAPDPRCAAGLTQYTSGALATKTSISNDELYALQGYELPTGLSQTSLVGSAFTGLVGSGASTVANVYKAIFVPVTNSISSDLEYFAKNVSYNILPLNNDSIEFYGKVYDKNLSNFISDVKFQVLDSNSNDITARFNAQCFNQNTGAQIGSTVLASAFNASACLNDRDTLSMARLVFRYDSVDYDGETDASIRAIIEDEYRTGSYTVNLNATSKNILSNAQVSTKVIPVAIKINPDNDILPPFTIADDSSLSNVLVDHGTLPSTGKPRDSNAWGAGIDYEIGSSNKKFISGTTTLIASETGAYKNMNYNYSLPVTSEKLGRIIFNKDLLPASALAKAYNIRVRVFDSKTTGCLYVSDSSLSSYMDGDHLGQLSANPKTILANVTNPLYFKYQFNAQVSTASKALVRPNGTSTTDNSSGCGSIASVEPEVTEKYDFIGNDDFVCQAGEVCYVNDLSKTTSNGVAVNSTNRIALKAYRVRVRMISEDLERTDRTQVVRVEKADSGIVSVANATFDVIPYVDNRMDPSNDGTDYNLAFNASNLDFVDYKSPGNSSVKVSVSAPALCSSGSPCTYKFIRYANSALDQGLKNTGSQSTVSMGYPILGHYAANDDLSASPVFSSSASSVMSFSGIGGPSAFINGVYTASPTTGTDLYNHNMEVLAIIKKDNVTYKKLINIAATHRIHEQPIMYAVKSVYSAGSLTGMKMIYDLNRYDEQGAAVAFNSSNPWVSMLTVSSDSYPHTVRQGFYPENAVQFQTSVGTTVIETVNYTPASATIPGLPNPSNYSSTEASSGYIFPIQGSNLNFWKLAQVGYADSAGQQVNGHWDNFYTYMNFKQCAEATPYFYYGASGWACYSDVSATADGWK